MKILSNNIRGIAFVCFLSVMALLSTQNMTYAGTSTRNTVQPANSLQAKDVGEPAFVAAGVAVLAASAVVGVVAFGIGVVNGYLGGAELQLAILNLEKDHYQSTDFSSFDI